MSKARTQRDTASPARFRHSSSRASPRYWSRLSSARPPRRAAGAERRELPFLMARRGGEGGIRTLDTVARMPHFECGAFDHSATSPSKGCQTLGANNAARLAGLVVERRALANEIPLAKRPPCRSDEPTSELQSLMRTSYAAFCSKQQTTNRDHPS